VPKGVTTQTRVDCGSMQRGMSLPVLVLGSAFGEDDIQEDAESSETKKTTHGRQRAADHRRRCKAEAAARIAEKEGKKWSTGTKVAFATAAVATGGATAIAYAMMNSGSGNYQLIKRPSWTDACLRMLCMCACVHVRMCA